MGTETTTTDTNNNLLGGIFIGSIVLSGVLYWWLTKEPKSKEQELMDAQTDSNIKENAAKAENTSKNNTPANDFTRYNTAKDIYPAIAKSESGVSLGNAVVIRAGVKPRRLNEKLEYVEDAPDKNVQVKLGNAWGWTNNKHELVTTSGKTITNVIVKSDNAKIAPFYSVKLSDIPQSGIKGTAEKVADKITSLFDDGQGAFINADGFDKTV